MDANKLKRLRAVGAVVNKCCELCTRSSLGVSGFGDCTLHTYEHAKHGLKFLSIYRTMSCDDFEPDFVKVERLLTPSGFDKLLDRRAFTRSNRHRQKMGV